MGQELRDACQQSAETLANVSRMGTDALRVAWENGSDSLRVACEQGAERLTERWSEGIDHVLAREGEREAQRAEQWQHATTALSERLTSLVQELAEAGAVIPERVNEILTSLEQSDAQRKDFEQRLQALQDQQIGGLVAAVDAVSRLSDRSEAGLSDLTHLMASFSSGLETLTAVNGRTLERLDGLQQSLDAMMLRADDQLAFQIEQARELIELSAMAHRDVFDQLQKLQHGIGGQQKVAG